MDKFTNGRSNVKSIMSATTNRVDNDQLHVNCAEFSKKRKGERKGEKGEGEPGEERVGEEKLATRKDEKGGKTGETGGTGRGEELAKDEGGSRTSIV